MTGCVVGRPSAAPSLPAPGAASAVSGSAAASGPAGAGAAIDRRAGRCYGFRRIDDESEAHPMDDATRQALETLFGASSKVYDTRGFRRRIGYGGRPALVNIDLANAWTRPDHAFSCEGMDTILPAVQQLLAAARAKGIPIVYTTTAYDNVDGPHPDSGLWQHKIPAEHLRTGAEPVEIDDRIAPAEGETVIVKKRASAFHGTFLAGYLRAARVDTVLLTGVTMSACVRNTAEDAIAEGFRPIVVREAVGDRIPGAVEWNLFDVDAKFGDVEPIAEALAYLDRLPTPNTGPAPGNRGVG